MKRTCLIYRFDEKLFETHKIINNSKHITLKQAEQIINSITDYSWADLTFKFYKDGSVKILDNNSDIEISPRGLTGACLDYYIRKRLELNKNKIKNNKVLQEV